MGGEQVGNIYVSATINTKGYDDGKKSIEDGNKELQRDAKKTSSSLASLASKGIKIATVATAGLATTIAGLSLKGGFDRALNIEDARAKLRGLGHDANSVETIMKNALDSVRGTSFGLDSAAKTAANAVASGIKPGNQLAQVLKTVANTSALAGRDMSEMGAIFNKVAASNKVQMDVINQLHDAGVPALALLSKEIGKTAEETAKMASDGKINFETFERAMRNGVGNAALEMGDTVRGSLANMRAAFSRAGAIIAEKILPHLKDAIQGITGWVDGVAKAIPGIIDSIISQFNRIKDAFTGIGENAGDGNYQSIGETIGKGIAEGLNNALKLVSVGTDTIKEWFSSIDWGQLGISIGRQAVAFALGFIIGLSDFDMGAAFRVLADNWLPALLGALSLLFAPSKLIGPLGKIFSKIPFGKTLIKYILKPIRNLGSGVRSAVGDLFSNLGGTISGKIGVIGNIFKTFGKILTAPFKIALDFIENQIRMLPLTIQQVFSGILGFIRTIFTGFLNIAKNIFTGIWNAVTTILRPFTEFFGGLFNGIWSNIKGIFSGVGNFFYDIFFRARSLVEGAFSAIINFFSDRWQGIKNVFGGVAEWFRDRFAQAWELIKRAFSSVGQFFSGIWDTILSKFRSVGTAVGDAIGGAFKSVINTVLSSAVNIINGFIKGINSVIGVIQNIPGVGDKVGKLSELSIPQLAKGGITTGPTLAMIGEGREKQEVVMPLSKLDSLLESRQPTNDNRPTEQPTIVIPKQSSTDYRQGAINTIKAFNEYQRSRGLPELGVA